MLIEADEIVFAFNALSQHEQAMSIHRAVIDALQHHVLEQHMPPVVQPDASILGVQLTQCAHQLLQGIPERNSAS